MILPQLWVKTGIREALKHILSMLTEAITTNFDYAHFKNIIIKECKVRPNNDVKKNSVLKF